jgi:hypothetical protein
MTSLGKTSKEQLRLRKAVLTNAVIAEEKEKEKEKGKGNCLKPL